ncbi:MAG TPA: ABC transporter permease, partial [bacterium]|nr:ABC transporter permease [bacterium]
YEDAERIHATIPAIEVMVPAKVIRSDVMYRTKRVDADVYGTVPWYPQTANKKILKGRFFTQKEALDGRNVCVLTNDLVKKLFTFEDPIGSRIRIRGEYFSVIGIIDEPVVAASGNSKAGNSNLNLFIPMTAARHRFGDLIMIYRAGSRSVEEVDLHKIIVKVDDVSKVMQTWEVIKDLLARFHKQQDYEIVVPLGLLREAARTKRIYNIVLGSIAAISLLVGGIGIMNIMLASVTERTREIGIRRALGARQKDIIIQFLTETVLLSTGGGLIGLMLGLAIPFLVTHFAGMMTIVRLWSLIVALGISILIGLIFGIYPAYRAAMMNPIEALRHE